MIPITRKEQYLNRLTGEEQAIPDEPITRTEQYLAKLCGEETEIPSSPITREEAYLAYLNGEDVTLPEPITRLEQFMAFAAEKSETKPTPLTREEFYWDKYQGGEKPEEKTIDFASIITVTDALAKPLKACTVKINPVQSGRGDPSPDNIRPISGWSVAKLTKMSTGNIWNETWEVGGYYGTSDGKKNTASNRIRSAGFIKVKAGEKYYINSANNAIRIFLYGTNHNYIGTPSSLNNEVYEIPNDVYYITFHMGTNYETTYNNDISINTPYTDTAYHAYTGNTYPITLPSEAGTVYGGTLDVVNGVLTVTKANIASYDGETLPGTWISDRDVYAEGTTPTTGAQVVYDLDTPITYQLTPTEAQMLLGTNNIWADSGDISITYLAKGGNAQGSNRSMALNLQKLSAPITEDVNEEDVETEEEEPEENADER